MKILDELGLGDVWAKVKELLKSESGSSYDEATPTASGLMSAADKKKLDSYTVAGIGVDDTGVYIVKE